MMEHVVLFPAELRVPSVPSIWYTTRASTAPFLEFALHGFGEELFPKTFRSAD